MAITESWLRANFRTAQERIELKADRDGLYARLSRDGKISWLFRYRWAGKDVTMTFAHYPARSLKEARDQVAEYRDYLDRGEDPRMIRQRELEKHQDRITVDHMFRAWYETYCKTYNKRPERIMALIELHIFPSLGHRPHDDIRADAWCELIEKLAARTPASAYKILSISKQVHSWASRRRMTVYQPLQGIRRTDIGITLTHGKRVLDDDEIVTMFNTLDVSRIDRKYKLVFKLCLLFACRSGELLQAHKSHFDFDAGLWTIPADMHKNGHITGRPLVRPIIPAAAELLQELFALSSSKRYVITRKRDAQPLKENALADIPVMLIKTAKKKLNADIDHFTFHDLRRTARTNFSNITTSEVAETMLGHVIPGIARVYDHNLYLDEQRIAYGRWWAKVESLVYGAGKVSLLKRGTHDI